MSHKTAFIVFAGASILFLAFSCPLTLVAVLTLGEELGLAIAIVNLLVDLVVGALTVVSLYWAATEFSEFAVKPDVRLLAGEKEGKVLSRTDHYTTLRVQTRPVRGVTVQVQGQWDDISVEGYVVPHIKLPLYFINTTRKAPLRPSLMLRVRAELSPSDWRFYQETAKPEEADELILPQTIDGEETMWVRFTDELIVYHYPIFIGSLGIEWPGIVVLQDLPELLTIDYSVYSLNGASSGVLKLQIEWS